ncbi:MAG TPA: nitrogenase iron protein, partial [Methanoregula sp.]|nr:nitrogenase iron protein [Methanoregula sp.]
EEELVSAFARRVNSTMIQYIPRDHVVQQAEVNRQTVIEFAPDSPQAGHYRSLAGRIMENTNLTIPTPLETDDLESLAREFL